MVAPEHEDNADIHTGAHRGDGNFLRDGLRYAGVFQPVLPYRLCRRHGIVFSRSGTHHKYLDCAGIQLHIHCKAGYQRVCQEGLETQVHLADNHCHYRRCIDIDLALRHFPQPHPELQHFAGALQVHAARALFALHLHFLPRAAFGDSAFASDNPRQCLLSDRTQIRCILKVRQVVLRRGLRPVFPRAVFSSGQRERDQQSRNLDQPSFH